MVAVPTLKMARVAPYLEAIEKARRAAWTWEDIRQSLNHLDIDTAENVRRAYGRALKHYRNGKLEVEQLPLPQSDSESQQVSQPNIDKTDNKQPSRLPGQDDTKPVRRPKRPSGKKTMREEAEELGMFDGKPHFPDKSKSPNK